MLTSTGNSEQRASLRALEAVLPQLDANSRSFGDSLIAQAARKGLTDKQWYWVGELAKRASEPADKPRQDVGSVQGIVDLLERAKKHLKHPAVIVRANGRDLRLNIAGPNSKAPGSINVCGAAGGYGERDWYGRVTRDGQFEPCRRYDERTQTAVAAALKALSEDPAKAAAEYGHLTGVCCFCNTPLTDERSTAVGYGPICAKHFGLPWGKEARAIETAAGVAVLTGSSAQLRKTRKAA